MIAFPGTNNQGVLITGLFGNPVDVTLSAWVNLIAADTSGAQVVSIGDNVGLRADAPGGAPGNGVTGFVYNGVTWVNLTTATFIAGTGWRHLAYTFSDTNNINNIYIDGSLVATAASATTISYTQGLNSLIGRHGNNGNSFDVNGNIEDVRVYDRALSDAEIATIYASRGHDNIVNGLQGRYPMLYDPAGTTYPAPTVSSVTTTAFAVASTTHNVSMPATVTAGDLLFMHISARTAGVVGSSFTTPTSWTALWSTTNTAASLAFTVTFAGFAKVADGTEGGTTVNFVTSAATTAATHVHRITNWFGDLTGVAVGTPATGASNLPDPPNLIPSWGTTTSFTLWLAVSGSGDDDITYTAAPATFTNLNSTVSGAGVNAGAETGSARLVSPVSSLNPGTFTLAASETWIANTVAIRPAVLTVDVSIFKRNGTPSSGLVAGESVISKRRRYS
jgi:hypothetical protein